MAKRNETGFEFDAKDFVAGLNLTYAEVEDVTVQTMHDMTDELIRIGSEITPLDKSTLSKSHTKKVKMNKFTGNTSGEVSFSVREGSFNYALWIHEGIYKHGKGTNKRPGTTGMSGKTYMAGRKFLERPVKGEKQAFWDLYSREIKKAVEKNNEN